jgi:putative tryptophan/tyrosine transport system substrate-binding protein
MPRRRIGFFITLALGLLPAPLLAKAQPAGKVPTVGVLSPEFPPPGPAVPSVFETFRQGLRDLGYVEGQNLRLEYRFAEWQLERLPALAAELVRLQPDVIVTYSTPGALAAKHATTTIPIVIGSAAGLVEQGLVASLARPGGNVTGLELREQELIGKRLQLLKDVAPQLSRLAALVNPTNPGQRRGLLDFEGPARALGVQVQRVEAREPGEFEAAFAAIAAGQAEALLIINDALFNTHRTRIVDFAATHRLPSISAAREFAEAGGLLA